MVKRPFTLEIVGVAGSGKSTLTRSLEQLDHPVIRGEYLRMRQLNQFPMLVRHSLAVLPMVFTQSITPQLTWTEFKLMVYLNGWTQFLHQLPSLDNFGTIMILDQGPIYSLARLGTITPPLNQSQRFTAWCAQVLRHWANFIDLIIWLDAPNIVLWQRIQGRKQTHEIKGASRSTGYAFLENYRQEYKRIIDLMSNHFSLAVKSFNTSQVLPGQMASDILTMIEQDLLTEVSVKR